MSAKRFFEQLSIDRHPPATREAFTALSEFNSVVSC